MQSSSVGWVWTPTTRQTASAFDLAEEESEATVTGFAGMLRFVNVAVLSPGQ
jgi:hypothetical protein